MTVSVVALVWIVITALAAAPIARWVKGRPSVAWVDPIVLCVLMGVAKIYGDALLAMPYAAYVLLVAYMRPRRIIFATLFTIVLAYLPKLILIGIGSDLAPQTTPLDAGDWLTSYVGPIFAGITTWALCTLMVELQNTTMSYEALQDAVDRAEASRAGVSARQQLAARLHDTVSQVVRAIPLRLSDPGPNGESDQAAHIRREAVAVARSIRPELQSFALELRDGSEVLGSRPTDNSYE